MREPRQNEERADAAPDGDRTRLDGAQRARLAVRAAVLRALREWFHGAGFLEMDPPALATSPGLEVHLAAVPVDLHIAGPETTRRYLVTSPEYFMKRLLGAGFERIYSLQKAWRDGDSSPLHHPEFTMLEWYRAHHDYTACMADTEALVLAALAAGGATPRRPRAGRLLDFTPPWPRLPFGEAMERYAGLDPLACPDVPALRRAAAARGHYLAPDGTWNDLVLQVFVAAVEPRLGAERPVILCEYPASMASLARLKPGDPRVAERFEVYAGGLELANGFSELIDAAEQRARCEADLRERIARGLPAYPLDERFLQALGAGLPPATGTALGVDRLVMLVTGALHIDEVVAFPPRVA